MSNCGILFAQSTEDLATSLAEQYEPIPDLPAVEDLENDSEIDQATRVKRAAPNESLGHILNIRFKGLNAIPEEDARDVVALQVGEELTPNKVEYSINDLRKWGVFANAEVILKYGEEGVELIYILEEGFLIHEVKISGNFPVFKRKVRRTLFLNRGAIYDHNKLAEQVDRIEALFEKEGYLQSTIFAIEDYDLKNREVTLHIKIKKGQIYRLRHINLEGNESLNPKRIRNIIFTFSHYKPRKIKNDIEHIRDLYRRKGFLRARVKLDGESYDYDARKVDVSLLIKEGPYVEIEFEGNKRIFTRILRKKITMVESGDFDEFEIEATKRKLETYYQLNGFEEIIIDWERKKVAKEHYIVTFKIDEGKRIKVKAIEFEGNQQVSDSKLQEQMLTQVEAIGERAYFYQPLFEEDLRSVIRYYHEEGYPDAKIESWEKNYDIFKQKVILVVKINEGQLYRIRKIDYEGLEKNALDAVQAKLLLKPGKAYSPTRLAQDIQNILVELANRGYPYAQVKHEKNAVEESQVDLLIKVKPHQRVKIGRILFVGNTLTHESVIRKNLRIKEGQTFSTLDLLRSEINLRGLGIFDIVNIETLGLASRRDIINVVVRVLEKKSKIIDVEAGYDTDRGFNGKVIFNKLNVFGSGKNMNFKFQLGQELSRIEANYIDPRLMGKSLQLVTGAYASYENRPFFSNYTYGGYGSLYKPLGSSFDFFSRLDINYVDFDDNRTVFEKLNPRENPQQRTRLTTSFGMNYDTRDNYGNPRRGIFASTSASFTNEFIQKTGNYLTLKGSFGHWYSPMRRVTLANALRVAQIWSLPSSSIVPVDQRLYLGGDNTVRGFDQDALLPSGGTFSLVHNFELQIRVFNQFQLVGFVDTGVVTNNIKDVNGTTIRHAAGPGIRYVTPVGPIRLDYGFVLDPRLGDDGDRRLHFSFGYFF